MFKGCAGMNIFSKMKYIFIGIFVLLFLIAQAQSNPFHRFDMYIFMYIFGFIFIFCLIVMGIISVYVGDDPHWWKRGRVRFRYSVTYLYGRDRYQGILKVDNIEVAFSSFSYYCKFTFPVNGVNTVAYKPPGKYGEGMEIFLKDGRVFLIFCGHEVYTEFYRIFFKGKSPDVKLPGVRQKTGIPRREETRAASGFQGVWYSVKTTHIYNVTDIFNMSGCIPCGWKPGTADMARGTVYVAPAVGGWTLVCGPGLPWGSTKEGLGEIKNFLRFLSSTFGEAQYFCLNEKALCFTWIKSSHGSIERAYSYSGEIPGTVLAEGRKTAVEKQFRLPNGTLPDKNGGIAPAGKTVKAIARAWSIDPDTLEKRIDAAQPLGILGNRNG